VWLQGSEHRFADLRKADRGHQPLPKFALAASLRAKTVFSESRVISDNVVAKLPGADPALAGEYVLLSAHIDHVGVGEPIRGDAIRNGAMDNASGVASLLEVARMLRESSRPPRRSLLFLACTAEEKGLLGSRYFAERPTVPIEKVVANINLDMFLPLGPLKMLRAYGLHETDLERVLHATAAEAGIGVQDDPQPQRNVFIRSDQYSFIKKGVPALFLSFGFTPGSPDARVYEQWFGARYHGPTDDLSQPLDKEAAAKFNRLLARIALEIANGDQRPQWRDNSFFRRFAQDRSTSAKRLAVPRQLQ
jgi:Zn-dependent M28 family amino/carboxypeptidase